MNAREEIIEHVGDRKVEFVHVVVGNDWEGEVLEIFGTFDDVLPLLDLEYDAGFGSQELRGCIWYSDGTWSDRGEYDGSEWWEYNSRPEIPQRFFISEERA